MWLLSKLYLQMAMFLDVSAIKHQTCIAKKLCQNQWCLLFRGIEESWRRQDFEVGHQSKRQERDSRNQDVRNFTQIQKKFPGNCRIENTTYFEKNGSELE